MELCFDLGTALPATSTGPALSTEEGASYCLSSGIQVYSKRYIRLNRLTHAFPFMIYGNTGSYLDWLRKTGIPDGWEQFLSESQQ